MVLFQQKLILLIFAARAFDAKIIILLSEKFEDCGDPAEKYIDWTGVEYEYVNDTEYYLTGN